MPSMASIPELARNDERRNQALDLALREIVPGRLAPDRLDAPDGLITAVRRQPPLDPKHAPFPAGIDPRLTDTLASRGLERLSTHQAEAIDHVLAGRNVVITTPTASGTTRCDNVPVLDGILENPARRAWSAARS
jgi:ATP-dependent helicase YprA (DUF1998 family)